MTQYVDNHNWLKVFASTEHLQYTIKLFVRQEGIYLGLESGTSNCTCCDKNVNFSPSNLTYIQWKSAAAHAAQRWGEVSPRPATLHTEKAANVENCFF